ncbi:hypothetical protein GCM10017566_43690 [Amycolatopsis bartoniae]|uniref:Uncharacterized protein n=1 Tax=Amycolatopsis bartoniae TaxID=941986 RepID=A0A8H9IYF1_9PSEU|nr:hypothetical protein GCM10017566_43690 [Amycolatopsis bartoniae]
MLCTWHPRPPPTATALARCHGHRAPQSSNPCLPLTRPTPPRAATATATVRLLPAVASAAAAQPLVTSLPIANPNPASPYSSRAWLLKLFLQTGHFGGKSGSGTAHQPAASVQWLSVGIPKE